MLWKWRFQTSPVPIVLLPVNHLFAPEPFLCLLRWKPSERLLVPTWHISRDLSMLITITGDYWASQAMVFCPGSAKRLSLDNCWAGGRGRCGEQEGREGEVNTVLSRHIVHIENSVKFKIKVRITLPTLFCRRYPDLSAVELWLSQGKGWFKG